MSSAKLKAAEKARKQAEKILAKRENTSEVEEKAKVTKIEEEKEDTIASAFGMGKNVASSRHVNGVLASREAAKDVKVIQFSMNAYGKELIQDTELELSMGNRYGLIGSNGSGKSQFLRAIAAREVPIPPHIDIFLLEHEAPPSDFTGVQWVIDDAQKEIKKIERDIESALTKYGPDCEFLDTLNARLETLNPETFEATAGKILHGLGFTQEMMKKATKELSGGWRMRVMLAKALFIQPSLLLLDEPTNHLDLGACVWLEEYLSTYDKCLVVISHSQDFLNGVCTNIMHLTQKKNLVFYSGNYDTYVQTKKDVEINQMKRYNKEQEDIAHIRAFVASCGTYSNLVRQAKSKLKIIEKMEEKGLTEKVKEDIEFNFRFPDCEVLPTPVCAFNDVAFSYSGKAKDALYHKVNIGLSSDSRVAIVGPNGAGKSTLLKLIIGDLTPIEGEVRRHTNLRLGRYNQHSTEVFPGEKSPLEFFRKEFESDNKEETEWRAHLAKFGITGSLQSNPINTLSDGLKSRLVFALMSVRNPNMLLLDEPTNHLDMQSIDALADAINHFTGGVIIVSHDFRLIQQMAKDIWVVDNKDVTLWKGDIRTYKSSLMKQMNKEINALYGPK